MAPRIAPKAKQVIFLFMAGAPSQLDLFDNKPALRKYDGQEIPAEIVKGERFAFIKGTPKLLGSPYEFRRHGQSGHEISDLLPHIGAIADDIAIVKSMSTTQFNHAPAQIFMNTGIQVIGRPSMGSWLSYGLGADTKDLPAFVVLISGENNPDGGKSCWGSGFLPTTHQGVEFRGGADPVLFVSNPDGVDPALRRASLDALKDLNGMRQASVGDPEIETRINAYELAYRMQTSVPELMDISDEPQAVHDLYGTQPGQTSFANNCLLARRLVERGVRFVQLYHRGWDTHGASFGDDVDREAAAPVPADRSGGRRAGQGPQAAGPARHDAGGVGRRVRPHADERSAQRLEVPRPRSSSACIHDVDGRRRHQAGHHLRRDRRTRLQHRARIPSRSTTCTRRCSTCSGSITRS